MTAAVDTLDALLRNGRIDLPGAVLARVAQVLFNHTLLAASNDGREASRRVLKSGLLPRVAARALRAVTVSRARHTNVSLPPASVASRLMTSADREPTDYGRDRHNPVSLWAEGDPHISASTRPSPFVTDSAALSDLVVLLRTLCVLARRPIPASVSTLSAVEVQSRMLALELLDELWEAISHVHSSAGATLAPSPVPALVMSISGVLMWQTICLNVAATPMQLTRLAYRIASRVAASTYHTEHDRLLHFTNHVVVPHLESAYSTGEEKLCAVQFLAAPFVHAAVSAPLLWANSDCLGPPSGGYVEGYRRSREERDTLACPRLDRSAMGLCERFLRGLVEAAFWIRGLPVRTDSAHATISPGFVADSGVVACLSASDSYAILSVCLQGVASLTSAMRRQLEATTASLVDGVVPADSFVPCDTPLAMRSPGLGGGGTTPANDRHSSVSTPAALPSVTDASSVRGVAEGAQTAGSNARASVSPVPSEGDDLTAHSNMFSQAECTANVPAPHAAITESSWRTAAWIQQARTNNLIASEARKRFETGWRVGRAFLVERGVLPDEHPPSFARVLRGQPVLIPGLPLRQICCEVFSRIVRDPYCEATLTSYLELFDMTGIPVDTAFRDFTVEFTNWDAPGQFEGQVWAKIQESFGRRYAQCNPGTLSASDCDALAGTVLFLHTSLHNTRISDKITCERFATLARQCLEHPPTLEEMEATYQRVAAAPWGSRPTAAGGVSDPFRFGSSTSIDTVAAAMALLHPEALTAAYPVDSVERRIDATYARGAHIGDRSIWRQLRLTREMLRCGGRFVLACGTPPRSLVMTGGGGPHERPAVREFVNCTSPLVVPGMFHWLAPWVEAFFYLLVRCGGLPCDPLWLLPRTVEGIAQWKELRAMIHGDSPGPGSRAADRGEASLSAAVACLSKLSRSASRQGASAGALTTDVADMLQGAGPGAAPPFLWWL